MARTVSQIYALMVADVQADPILSTLVPAAPQLPSKRSIWGLFIYIFASAIFLLESLMDVFKSQVEHRPVPVGCKIKYCSFNMTPLHLKLFN